jgi:hypothetical protein
LDQLKGLQSATESAARAASTAGQGPHLSLIGRHQGDDTVCLAIVHAANDKAGRRGGVAHLAA